MFGGKPQPPAINACSTFRILNSFISTTRLPVVPGFELFNRMFQQLDGTPYAISQPMANFLSGGLASNLYWITALRETLLFSSGFSSTGPGG
jgi:hypothetical protein